jgi:hypothetical protein
MEIRTTVYINNVVLNRINDASGDDKKFRNKLIIALMKRVMQDHDILEKNFMSVKYQNDDAADKWRTLHVRFGKGENEYFQDMRRVFKMSVSLILAYAVKNYFSEVLNDLIRMDIVDNYPPKNYLLLKDIIDGIVSWRLFWGFPANPEYIFNIYQQKLLE